MPCFRGIEISIHASLEAKQVIEYPHPDASSVRLVRATTLDQESQPGTPSAPEDVDPVRLKKVNPRISVYIPSLPGEQFWLRYLINQSPPPSRCIFFKMTMNGRHIASWGINTSIRSTGSVVRALYQPVDKWGNPFDQDESDYPGIETRYFHFMPGLEKKSVADDGGLIEVQVFRCKGRKRIATKLDAYRNQERYGIASPSGGLVDNPEDATYYNYYLVDPKDAPYATFCFHYRSMKYLKQLNLVPPISPASKSPRVKRSRRKSRSEATSPLPQRFAIGAGMQESQAFNGNVGATDKEETEHAETNPREEYFLNSPPELLQSSLRETVAAGPNEALESEHSAEVLQRPLPEIPNAQARPPSASSLRSNCPSLTPSLRQYVESEDFDNEEIRLSTAQPLLIPSESMQALELASARAEEGTSVSDYATSPSSTETSNSPTLPSPAGYIATTGSVLERHLTQYDSPLARSSPSRVQSMPSSNTDSPLSREQTEPRTGILNLTEAEWLRHTPSPLKRKGKRAECLWSPRPEAQSARSSIEEPVRVSDVGTQSMALPICTSKGSLDTTDQAPIGNWI
ncbi:hypothetical protein HD806DRAFT_526533 [Xylariaceae sp. AK1471]|nr:hypothetical protein HD806DRAFT_526533 [Xylariaceae sp. AK1471]